MDFIDAVPRNIFRGGGGGLGRASEGGVGHFGIERRVTGSSRS